MKRVIIAVAMVLFLVILAAASDMIISNQMKALYDDTKSLNQNIESVSDKELKIKSETIIEKWKGTEKLLHYFDSHDKYEEISKCFGQLEISIEKNDKNGAAAITVEIQNLINNYIDSRKINLQNILIITNQLQ